MNNSIKFYKTLSAEALHEYAEKGGLGVDNPRDLEEFRKFIKEGNSVLEVGCGTGRIGRHLICENYVGLETNSEYINIFLAKIEDRYKDNIKNIDFLDFKSEKLFDVILFPWSVFFEFSNTEQKEAIIKSMELLNKGGKIVIDIPAKGATYNSVAGHEPNIVYFEDLIDLFDSLNISKYYKSNYETRTGRLRELIVLEK